MYSKILFPTDFSPHAARAEEHVRALARLHEASCLVLHVVEALAGEEDDELRAFYEGFRARAAKRMDATLLRLADDGIEHAGRIVIGARWQVILETAEDESCDLIVMGCKAGVAGRPYLGSTSVKVFLGSETPLLVVRS